MSNYPLGVTDADIEEAFAGPAECLNVDVKDLLNSSINDDIQLVRWNKWK